MSCSNLGKIKELHLYNPKDWIYKDGFPYRLKRKYGKYDRKNALIIIPNG